MNPSKIELKSININRGWKTNSGLEGKATFGDGGVEIQIELTKTQIAKIIEACADSIIEKAKEKTQAFYESASDLNAKLLEAPKEDENSTDSRI